MYTKWNLYKMFSIVNLWARRKGLKWPFIILNSQCMKVPQLLVCSRRSWHRTQGFKLLKNLQFPTAAQREPHSAWRHKLCSRARPTEEIVSESPPPPRAWVSRVQSQVGGVLKGKQSPLVREEWVHEQSGPILPHVFSKGKVFFQRSTGLTHTYK